MLRYDSPVQLTSRTATRDAEIVGVTIPKGEEVIILLAGANRDPDVFDNPDEFKIDRANVTAHLSFSQGIHHCLGHALARLEAQVACEELTCRYEQISAAGNPVRRDLLVLRGFAHTWTPVPRHRQGGLVWLNSSWYGCQVGRRARTHRHRFS